MAAMEQFLPNDGYDDDVLFICVGVCVLVCMCDWVCMDAHVCVCVSVYVYHRISWSLFALSYVVLQSCWEPNGVMREKESWSISSPDLRTWYAALEVGTTRDIRSLLMAKSTTFIFFLQGSFMSMHSPSLVTWILLVLLLFYTLLIPQLCFGLISKFWFVCLYVCMFVCMYGCMYVCLYVCMWLYGCLFVYIYIYIYIYVCVCVCVSNAPDIYDENIFNLNKTCCFVVPCMVGYWLMETIFFCREWDSDPPSWPIWGDCYQWEKRIERMGVKVGFLVFGVLYWLVLVLWFWFYGYGFILLGLWFWFYSYDFILLAFALVFGFGFGFVFYLCFVLFPG